MIEKEWVDKQTEHMQNIFDKHGVKVTALMLIGQIFALLLTWQIQLMSCPRSSVEKSRR
jgi:hypothetical protein